MKEERVGGRIGLGKEWPEAGRVGKRKAWSQENWKKNGLDKGSVERGKGWGTLGLGKGKFLGEERIG